MIFSRTARIARRTIPQSIGFLVICLTASPLLAAGTTVGVYDENISQTNAVDFTASGSAVDYPTFAAQVLAAFAADRGGVINCDDTSLPFEYAFGVNQTKRIQFAPSPGYAYSSLLGGYGPCVRTPISGANAYLYGQGDCRSAQCPEATAG